MSLRTDRLCKCGHPRSEHQEAATGRGCACLHRQGSLATGATLCNCKAFSDTERSDNHVRANEIRKALTESVNGRSGRNVLAMNSQMEWHRITAVKTHREMVYGLGLNSGQWFVIHQWREQ